MLGFKVGGIMKQHVLFILFLNVSLLCLAVVRPPLVNRLFNRYYTPHYRLPTRTYNSLSEKINAIKANQEAIKDKIVHQTKLIKNIEQHKTEAKWSDAIPGFKNLREQYNTLKLKKAKTTLKKLEDAKEAGYRNWAVTLEQLDAKKLNLMNKEYWKK